jgi:hypothetical protein
VGYSIRIHETLNPDRVQSAAGLSEDSGFCIACGAAVEGLAQDVQQYRCPFCHQLAVYSAVKVWAMLT